MFSSDNSTEQRYLVSGKWYMFPEGGNYLVSNGGVYELAGKWWYEQENIAGREFRMVVTTPSITGERLVLLTDGLLNESSLNNFFPFI